MLEGKKHQKLELRLHHKKLGKKSLHDKPKESNSQQIKLVQIYEIESNFINDNQINEKDQNS